MCAPHPEAIDYSRAITHAIKDAKIDLEDIDYVNCHGTGTRLNDSAESMAIKNALGKHAYRIPIGSIKSMIGHAFGGATAIETVSSIQSLMNNIVPPTINHTGYDNECDLDCVPNAARQHKCNYILKTGTGFGGSNMALILKKESLSCGQ